MATTTRTKLTEHVYSGGTVVFAAGSELTEEQAHIYGVTAEGTIDRCLSTDDLRKRHVSVTGESETVRSMATNLGDATAEQVIEYLYANPAEVDQVADIEGARSTPRKTVLEAIERVRSSG